MNDKMPRTPFSTPLSGSARETEIRLKNIFSGPKKRPPVLFLALMFAVCIFCGDLVSCQRAEAEAPATSVLDGQGMPVDPEQPPLSAEEEDLLQALFQAAEAEQPFQLPHPHLMNFIQKEDRILGAVFVEDFLENTLILGVVDKETHEIAGPLFRWAVHAGVADVVTFQDYDGEDCLLYTLNGQMNGQYTGVAGLVRFDGKDITWEWPVEGDVREADSAAAREYQDYWLGYLAVMAPGGVDIYEVDPEFEWGREEPWSMWQLSYGETFYYDSSSAVELPMPVYFQSLAWLNEHTNDPGGWRIVSLALDEEKCDPEKMLDCYTLRAASWDDAEHLTACLYFSYEQEGQRRSYEGLELGKLREDYHTSPGEWDDSDKWDDEDDWDWDDGKWEVWDEEWEKEQEARQIAEYQSVGVTMDGKDYYYQGQLVNVFLDIRPDRSVYTLNMDPAGTVSVKILRSEDGTITGAAYMTKEEVDELLER